MELMKLPEEPIKGQNPESLDCSELLGANAAFLPHYDAILHAELVNAYCNKIGGEGPL